MFTKPLSIPYTLKRFKKSKSLKLKICSTGEVLITAPSRLSKSYIESFIQEQKTWIEEKLKHIESLPQPGIKTQKGDYKKYKEQARDIVEKQIEKLNIHYKFIFKKIYIRDQKTRWGSCSAKKNLSFNYKLSLIPEKLTEYVVAHELCHLKEMNHGPKFWKLVEETIPDYQKRQTELRNLRL